MNTLIKNADILMEDYSVSRGDIAIRDDTIVAVGAVSEDFKADNVIQGDGHMAVPGFVNTHTHSSMTLLRSYADDLALMEWLNDYIWPVEAKMNRKDIRVGNELALLEMIRTGTTAYNDMYGPWLEEVAEATIEAGIRGLLGRGPTSFSPQWSTAIEENVQLYKDYHGAGDGRISVAIGVHAPYTCKPEMCQKASAAAKELGAMIHIHMNETQDELKMMQEQYGISSFKYIEENGILDNKVIAAHCVWLSDEDIQLMKKYDVAVAHNPASNMKLASGISPVPRLLEEGIVVGLGTDGCSSNNNLDMLEEIRLVAMLHKLDKLDPLAVPAATALKMGTELGAKALGMNDVGVIKPGYKADIVLFNTNRSEWCPKHNLLSLLVYSASSSSIDGVICNGKVLMEKGELKTMDEEKILFEAQKTADELIER